MFHVKQYIMVWLIKYMNTKSSFLIIERKNVSRETHYFDKISNPLYLCPIKNIHKNNF